MKRTGLSYLIALLAAAAVLTGSCAEQACLDETVAEVKAFFYKTGTGKSQAPDSITLFGMGRDTSRIYDKAENQTYIKLPLDPGSVQCTFILKINDITDTVTFLYSSYPHLVSAECGFTYFHNLDTVTGKQSDIDFIIINRNITTTDEENIRIFY
jgi:hypothetical protein